VKKLDLPKDVSLDGGGGSDETVEVFQSLGLAILTKEKNSWKKKRHKNYFLIEENMTIDYML